MRPAARAFALTYVARYPRSVKKSSCLLLSAKGAKTTDTSEGMAIQEYLEEEEGQRDDQGDEFRIEGVEI
jgi:hypothetical protein